MSEQSFFQSHQHKDLSSMSLRLQARPDLCCEIIPCHEMAKIIESVSPFRDRHFAPREIPEYITNVTGDLIKKDLPLADLSKHCLTASALILVARPLLNLSIEENIIRNFVKAISKSPYQMTAPFEVIFRNTEESEIAFSCEESWGAKFEPIEKEIIGDSPKVKASEQIRKRISNALDSARADLSNGYSEMRHFAFIGFAEICGPLFGVESNQPSEDFVCQELLALKHGRFYLPLPFTLWESIQGSKQD